MSTDLEIPGDVLSFAESVGGRPIAWRYGEFSVTIVMEDGRKLVFNREEGDLADDVVQAVERALKPGAVYAPVPLPVDEAAEARRAARSGAVPATHVAGMGDAGVKPARPKRAAKKPATRVAGMGALEERQGAGANGGVKPPRPKGEKNDG